MTEEYKQYTDKQLLFLDALMGEAKSNIRKAMDVAGYAKTTKISEVVRSLNKEIIKAAEEMLAMNAPKAAFGIVDLLDVPSAMGARNSIAAAREILDRTGLVKKEQLEVTNKGGGVFILPPKAVDDVG